MASRCALVILGISIPFEVETMSRIEEALGVVVPIPAEPVEGNVFDCAQRDAVIAIAINRRRVFIIII